MVKPALSICFSNPPCLLRLADPRHRRSRLRPILLSPPSPFSRFRRLTPPFSVSGILRSSSSHIRLWPSELKPKRVSVLRKSTKKEEPVLEGLLKQYFDDDLMNPQLITMYGGTNGFGQGTRDTHPLPSPPTAGGSDTPVASMLPGQLKLQPPREAPELFQRLRLLKNTHYTSEGPRRCVQGLCLLVWVYKPWFHEWMQNY